MGVDEKATHIQAGEADTSHDVIQQKYILDTLHAFAEIDATTNSSNHKQPY